MKQFVILLLIVTVLTAGPICAQPDSLPDSLWSRSFGGEGDDRCSPLIQTADGGFALAGWTYSFGAADFWLVRVDEEGDSLWSRTFGGEGDDWCEPLIQTTDGGFALAGGTLSFGAGGEDFWLVRVDEEGDSLWSRSFGGEGWDGCYSLIQTADGGFALAGYTWSFGMGGGDFWLVRCDENGDSLWARTYGGRAYDHCTSLIQTADDGFALAGYTESFGAGGEDFWLVRVDEDGDSLWSRSFGGEGDDGCYSLIQTADGGFALAGRTNSFGAGEGDFWLVRSDENGDSLWSRSFGGEGDDSCSSLIRTAHGGFALAGRTNSFGAGESDFWLVRTNENGDSLLWSRTFGGRGFDECTSLIRTADGGFALAGSTESFGAGEGDFWLVKTGPDPVSVPGSDVTLHPWAFILSPPHPNPFNSRVNLAFTLGAAGEVELLVTDACGRQVARLLEGLLPRGFHRLTWDAAGVASGSYIIQLRHSGGTVARAVTLLR